MLELPGLSLTDDRSNLFIKAISALPGVEGVSMIANHTNEAIGAFPARSFMCVVKGGDKKAVAQTIFDGSTIGYLSVGSTTVIVKRPWADIDTKVKVCFTHIKGKKSGRKDKTLGAA